jgi:hypothetical protein
VLVDITGLDGMLGVMVRGQGPAAAIQPMPILLAVTG